MVQTPDDDVLLDNPLSVGVLAGGANTLAALDAFAARCAYVRIKVVREVEDDE